MFCWHKWGMWSDPISSFRDYPLQARKCERCGAIVRREVRGTYSEWQLPSEIIKALREGGK